MGMPPWPVADGDTDCDGFPDSIATIGKAPESYIGTDAAQPCAATSAPDDEADPDAWPVDLNDDQVVNGADIGRFGVAYAKRVAWGPFGPQSLPGERFDFNGNGIINGQDIGRYALYYNMACSPIPTPTPTAGPPTPTPTAAPPCAALPTPAPSFAPWQTPPVAGNYTLTLLPADAAVDKLTDVIPVPNDPGRAVITSETGEIWTVCLGDNSPRQEIADLTDVVRDFNGTWDGDEGLVSFVFDPIDPSLVYVDYSMGQTYLGATPNADTVRSRISRFQIVNGQLDRSSEKVILDIYQPGQWHNGDALVFGPDGMLYIGSGDGGAGAFRGQTLDDLYGAVLRIDVHSGDPYAIPADNPFADGLGGNADEVWLYGLRNPWRFSFDGDRMWLTDVGETAWEEVNIGERGANYGWDTMEGPECFLPLGPTPTPGPTCSAAGLATPRAAYYHSDGCSITGGHVYHGAAMPELDGYYIYGDWCRGKVWALNTTNDAANPILIADTDLHIVSWAISAEGEIVAVNYHNPNYLPPGATPGIYRLERLP
jgi:glucose/arabinose dehydrogenase